MVIITSYPTRANGIIVLVNSQTGFCRRFLFPQFYKAKILNLAHYFPYDVKLRILAHSRSFLANQKAGNAIFGAENLLKVFITSAFHSAVIMLRKYQKCVVVYSAITIFTDKKLKISMPDGLVQSLKSPFFPPSTPYIGAEPGWAKGEFRILNRGKTIFATTFQIWLVARFSE